MSWKVQHVLNLVNLFLILRGKGGGGRAFYTRETSKHSGSAEVPRVSRSESQRDLASMLMESQNIVPLEETAGLWTEGH